MLGKMQDSRKCAGRWETQMQPLGDSFNVELRRPACLARDRKVERGLRAGAVLRSWRQQLQAALARSVTAALLAASARVRDGGTEAGDGEEEEGL